MSSASVLEQGSFVRSLETAIAVPASSGRSSAVVCTRLFKLEHTTLLLTHDLLGGRCHRSRLGLAHGHLQLIVGVVLSEEQIMTE